MRIPTGTDKGQLLDNQGAGVKVMQMTSPLCDLLQCSHGCRYAEALKLDPDTFIFRYKSHIKLILK